MEGKCGREVWRGGMEGRYGGEVVRECKQNIKRVYSSCIFHLRTKKHNESSDAH